MVPPGGAPGTVPPPGPVMLPKTPRLSCPVNPWGSVIVHVEVNGGIPDCVVQKVKVPPGSPVKPRVIAGRLKVLDPGARLIEIAQLVEPPETRVIEQE